MDARQFVILISLASFLLIPFRSSNEFRYRCPDCGKGFTDPAPRTKHRKTAHGYQPYHTPRYYARQALKEAEKRANLKAATGKTRDQQAAHIFPRSTQSASSSSSTPSSASSSADSLSNLHANTTYHNDSWKPLVDVPCRGVSGTTISQEVLICAPVAAAPARDTPKTLCSDSDLSSPKVGQ
jgi:uncharacterized C2H2 Zn-finger protein